MKLPEEGYIRIQQVLSVYPVAKSTWWRGVKEGKYPKGVKLEAKVTGWDVNDIRKLLEQKKSL